MNVPLTLTITSLEVLSCLFFFFSLMFFFLLLISPLICQVENHPCVIYNHSLCISVIKKILLAGSESY